MRGLLPVLGLAALAGCGRAPAPATPGALPAAAGPGGSIEWQGQRGCADCDGIATRLVLHEGPRGRDYDLTEVYAAEGAQSRFAEHGRWQRDEAVLRLRGDRGSRRWYMLLPDGRLQPRDAHGAPLGDGAEDDLLVPVAGSTP
ncbi:MAG: copper resistance protein NlpE N-terminal domain-containing protein [Lysobacteraceae bacterium]